MQTKNELRTQMKELISKMRNQEISHASQKIIEQIIPLVDRYDVRAIFLPLSDEPQIKPLINLLLDHWKLLIYPQVDGNILIPMVYTADARLRRWAHGLQEIKQPTPYMWPIDIILVPGRAFSRDGKRLGRWFGYYDTFLSQYPHTKKIWLCFLGQIVDDVPVTENDVSVDGIVFG